MFTCISLSIFILGLDYSIQENPNLKNIFSHRRTSSLGKGRMQFEPYTENESATSFREVAAENDRKINKLRQKVKSRNSATSLIKKKLFCHPRRMLRVKSNCRFLLLAILTLSTLMLLFTVTEIDRQNSPVIQDILYRAKDEIEDVKKNLQEDNLLLKKKRSEEKLRVDKKYLLALGLPANPDDINFEVR